MKIYGWTDSNTIPYLAVAKSTKKARKLIKKFMLKTSVKTDFKFLEGSPSLKRKAKGVFWSSEITDAVECV